MSQSQQKGARGPRIRSLIAAVGVAAGALVAVPATANADYYDCNTYEFCLWEALAYDGLIWHRSGVTDWENFAYAINDEGSSVANRRDNDSAYNAAYDGASTTRCFDEHTQLIYVGDYWNDEMSSARNWAYSGVC